MIQSNMIEAFLIIIDLLYQKIEIVAFTDVQLDMTLIV